MATSKPRIATYTKKVNIDKMRIISAFNGKSMSEFLEFLIEREITEFESKYGKIKMPPETSESI